jgi:hypothetical protein
MSIDAWWFNNNQTIEDALYQIPEYPDAMPKTHLGIYAEGIVLEFPVHLDVTATSNEKILYEKQLVFTETQSKTDEYIFDIHLNNSKSVIDGKIIFETLPVLPEKIKVLIKSGEHVYSREINCEYATLSGTIVDFSGKPFPSPFILRRTSFENSFELPYMWVWSRKDGTYSITVPKGIYHHFYVDDNTYGISTLENWGWHMIVDQDETHDFKVGTGEVYSLCVWANNGGFSTLFIYFRPMILKKPEKYQVELNGIHYTGEDICPVLTLDDISVTVNGHELTKLSLQKIYETGADGGIMPAYILQVKRYPEEQSGFSTLGKQTLIVEYNTIDENGHIAQSQGRTQFFYSNIYAYSLL